MIFARSVRLHGKNVSISFFFAIWTNVYTYQWTNSIIVPRENMSWLFTKSTGDYFLLKNQDFDNDSQFVQELFDWHHLY